MEESELHDEYRERINRVMDFARTHLGEDLGLERLAQVACFSPYHFHRVFSAMVGQTPREFVEAARLDWAANCLSLRPDLTITEIALSAGYSGPAAFARAFRARFELSAADYRAVTRHKKELKAPPPSLPPRRPDFPGFSCDQVKLERLGPYHVAFARSRTNYAQGIASAWSELEVWARSRELLDAPAQLLGLPWDNPDVTPDSRLSYFACIEVGPAVRPSRGIALMDIEGGLYARYPFEGKAEDIMPAYGALYGKYLPRSGLAPDDRPGIELYPGPIECFGGLCLAYDICIPVRPLD